MPRFNSTKRPTALKDTDYDHEILLLDHTATRSSLSPARTRSYSASEGESRRGRDPLTPAATGDDTRRHSDDHLRRKGTRQTLREELAKRKYGKYSKFQDRRESRIVDTQPALEPTPTAEPTIAPTIEEGIDYRPSTASSQKSQKKAKAESESAIDILYENQRGGFLCGIPLFSSRALGSADKPPWTNSAFKASATSTTTAQVPDPSWKWAWKEWSVNHSDDVDADGWEYAFMYAKWCSWHGPHWYNSFVRRRAWIRKRVKKHARMQMEAHRLNSDYFTIHPTMSRSRSPSKAPSMVESRMSLSRGPEPVAEREDIADIGALMAALKASRIDREKTEAIENFIKNGGEDLIYLSEKMHDIMAQFIFQASRRSLLVHLTQLLEEESASAKLQSHSTSKDDEENFPHDLLEVPVEGKPEPEDKSHLSSAATKLRLENIEKAYHAADKAVKTLEYWSDVKDVATSGDMMTAVDEEHGWDERWVGVDASAGPKDVITDPVVGRDEELAPEDGGEVEKRVSWMENILPGSQGEAQSVDKGKGKETA